MDTHNSIRSIVPSSNVSTAVQSVTGNSSALTVYSNADILI